MQQDVGVSGGRRRRRFNIKKFKSLSCPRWKIDEPPELPGVGYGRYGRQKPEIDIFDEFLNLNGFLAIFNIFGTPDKV